MTREGHLVYGVSANGYVAQWLDPTVSGDPANLAACPLAGTFAPSVRFVMPPGPGESAMAQRARLAENLTVDEFMVLDTPEGNAELVRGELRLTPSPGPRHGVVVANLTMLLGLHVKSTGSGRVLTESCYELVQLPRTVRAPDASFVRTERLPPGGLGDGQLKIPPDLAVEILSPSETASRLDEKLEDYAASRVPLVWVIDPERRSVRVIAVDAPVRWLREGDTLDGGSTIPGFACPVSDLFVGLAAAAAP